MTELLLRWGISARFREYFHRIGDATIQVSEGAKLRPDGRVDFPQSAALGNDYGFQGAVLFIAYDGLLRIRVASPLVRMFSGSKGLLYVEPPGYQSHPAATLPLAEFTAPKPQAMSCLLAPMRLHAKGTVIFDSQYPPGQVLDPVELLRC